MPRTADLLPRCRQLIARAFRRVRAQDRGSASSLMAVLTGGGVLMGMGAVVVDVGRLYQEREELQSGADAAALALAKVCVNDLDDCVAGAAGVPQYYANRNAKDGRSAVSLVCGSPSTGLPACPATNSTPGQPRLTECIDVDGAPPSGPYVEVHTVTATEDGSMLLPPSFARAIAGGNAAGSAVGACARAAWGSPDQVTGVAVTMSYCAWRELTSVNGVPGKNLGPTPPEVATDPSVEGFIRLHGSSGSTTCPAVNPSSGWQAPGGFSWLNENSGPCKATVNTDGNFGGDTGNNVSQGCKSALPAARANLQVLWMPVFQGVKGTGSNTIYDVAGVSAFVLTGYRLPSMSEPSWLSNKHLCLGGNEACLYGYFTTGLYPANAKLSDSVPNYGVKVIQLAG